MADTQYVKSVKVVEPKDGVAQVAERNMRQPWLIAANQMSENVSINGEAVNPAYIPEVDMFSSAVIKKGVVKGWGQVVWIKIDKTGQAVSEPCFFDDKTRRIGGTFHKSLNRAIIRKDFAVKISDNDFYAYCDKGTPMVVVPLMKLDMGLAPTYTPAGAAVYNGKTGELKIHKDIKRGDVIGPIYSKWLSRKVIDSTASTDGFWSWLWAATGYGAYGGENSSELVLGDKTDDSASFITPLTMIGRGKAITAVGQQDASAIEYGKLNKYIIAKLPTPRQGNNAVQDRIKADHAGLEWATGMKIFEIVPNGPERWTATLGQNKSVMYTLTINPDSSSCLHSVRGEKLRCTNDKEDVIDVEVSKSDDPLNLAKMSNAELLKLQESVHDEVAKRLK